MVCLQCVFHKTKKGEDRGLFHYKHIHVFFSEQKGILIYQITQAIRRRVLAHGNRKDSDYQAIRIMMTARITPPTTDPTTRPMNFRSSVRWPSGQSNQEAEHLAQEYNTVVTNAALDTASHKANASFLCTRVYITNIYLYL